METVTRPNPEAVSESANPATPVPTESPEYVLRQKVTAFAGELLVNNQKAQAIHFLHNLAIEALNQLATASASPRDCDSAIKYIRLAEALDDQRWPTLVNAAHVYNIAGNLSEACSFAARSVGCSGGGEFTSLFNYGVVLANSLRCDEAISLYRQAVALNPDSAVAHNNLSAPLLSLGQYKEGWQEYEWRMKAFDQAVTFRARFTQPDWTGQEDGKLLCYSEQGIGDLFHFCRFLPELKTRHPKLVVEVQQEALPFLQRQFPDIDMVGRCGPPNYPVPPEADYVCSVCSLPHLLGYDSEEKIMAQSKPYFTAVERKIPINSDKMKVGFVWAGAKEHGVDFHRSCHKKWFARLGFLEGVELFSLQRNTYPVRLWPTGTVNLDDGAEAVRCQDLGVYLNSFDDLAYCVSQMDLIVSVDTSLVHLAGAMGKPVWTILPYQPDWRWLLWRDDCPWYPSMRLFRLPGVDKWAEGFAMVENAMAEWSRR